MSKEHLNVRNSANKGGQRLTCLGERYYERVVSLQRNDKNDTTRRKDMR